MTINFDLRKDKKSIFATAGQAKTAEAFIAGVRRRARECALFAHSVPSSYDRLATYKQITSIAIDEKRDSFMRFTNKHGAKKLALRAPDNACNLYLTVALALRAGLEGIKEGLTADQVALSSVPSTIEEAIKEAENSAFLKEVLGEKLLSAYVAEKKKAAEEYQKDAEAYTKKEFERL